MREDQEHGICYRIFHPFAKEFQLKNFGLSHQPVDDFCKSQWQKQQRSYFWLLYRWSLAVCFSVGVLGSATQQFYAGKWLIYLTDWGFTLCMCTSIYGAVIATVYAWKPHKFAAGNRILKFYWALHWITLVAATLVTFIYWIFIYPVDVARASDTYNLWAHGFNSILMVLDHMLVAFPTRLLHFIYPLIVGIIYAIFSIVYYFAGGVDIAGNHYIYEILDYSRPGLAVATLVGCMLLLVIFSTLLFCLYKLRCFIYRKCNNSMMQLNA